MGTPDEQKICVWGMPSGVTKNEVRNFFGECGNVDHLYLKDNGVDTFGIIGFDKVSSRDQALKYTGRNFNDLPIRVEIKSDPESSNRRGTGQKSHQVFVGSIRPQTTNKELISFFESNVGPVTYFSRKEGGSAYAFVGFASAREQALAFDMRNREIGRSRIRVEQKGGAPLGLRERALHSRSDSEPFSRRPRKRSESPQKRRRRYDSESPQKRRRRYDSESPQKRRRRYDSESSSRHLPRYDSVSLPRQHRKRSRCPLCHRRYDSQSPSTS